jgi:hypothetical protein
LSVENVMAEDEKRIFGPRPVRPLIRFARGAAATTARPLTNAAESAFKASIELERRAVDRAFDSPELAGLLTAVIDDERLTAALRAVVESDAAKQLIASFFDSGLFDEFIDRLLASPGLWRLVDQIAASPAVTAAVQQQSLGFADQVGEEVRTRSRGADDWLERTARRLAHRHEQTLPPGSGEPKPGTP